MLFRSNIDKYCKLHCTITQGTPTKEENTNKGFSDAVQQIKWRWACQESRARSRYETDGAYQADHAKAHQKKMDESHEETIRKTMDQNSEEGTTGRNTLSTRIESGDTRAGMQSGTKYHRK